MTKMTEKNSQPNHKQFHEQNRLSWNAATQAHRSHKVNLGQFFKNGGSTLYPEEKALLGDITNKTLLHLQCNDGQDTLSLANLGATVSGVDISDTAIEFARQTAHEAGIVATFHRADVYDWLADAEANQFDCVFSSYGAICWLSDLGEWGKGIHKVLKKGGRFVLVDFHPVMDMFEDDWQLKYDYFNGQVLSFDDGVGDYVAGSYAEDKPDWYQTGVTDFKNPHPTYEFMWGISEIVMNLIQGNLRLEILREYPYTNGFKFFPEMVNKGNNQMHLPKDKPKMPLMYGIVVVKP